MFLLSHPRDIGKEANLEGILAILKRELTKSKNGLRFIKDEPFRTRVKKISKFIGDRLKSGDDVVIAFRSLLKDLSCEGDIASEFLKQFIEEIWIPIKNSLAKNRSIKGYYTKFLLFFVEDEEISSENKLYQYFIREVKDQGDNNIPFLLPAIEPLKTKDFHDWTRIVIGGHNNEDIKKKFGDYKFLDCKKYLLERCQDNHVSLFEEIYYDFNLNFKEL